MNERAKERPTSRPRPPCSELAVDHGAPGAVVRLRDGARAMERAQHGRRAPEEVIMAHPITEALRRDARRALGSDEAGAKAAIAALRAAGPAGLEALREAHGPMPRGAPPPAVRAAFD